MAVEVFCFVVALRCLPWMEGGGVKKMVIPDIAAEDCRCLAASNLTFCDSPVISQLS